MNEGDFDKLFNDKFKDFEGSDFSSTEWGGLDSRLKKRRNRRKGLFWLLPLLLLSALAGGGLATWYQLHQISKKLPKQPLIEQNEQNPTTDTLRDTILKRSIIYQYDTIYRKILIIDEQDLPNPSSILGKKFNDFLINEKKQADKLSQLNTPLMPNGDTGILITAKNVLPSNPKTDKSIEQALLEDKNITPKITDTPNKISESLVENEITQVKKLNMHPLSKNEKKDRDTLQNIDNITTETKNKEGELKEEKELKPIIKTPLRFPPISLGIIVAKPWEMAADYSEMAGSQVGIRAEIKASNKFNFFSELNYGQFKVESPTGNTLPSGITIPEPDPSFAFKYWSVEGLKILNYIGGVQYKFKGNNALKPYISAGINGTTILPYQLKFEYINTQNDTEKYVYEKVAKSKTQFKNLYAAVGVHWYPLSKLQFSAEGFTSYPVNNTPLIHQQSGIKVSVLYLMQH